MCKRKYSGKSIQEMGVSSNSTRKQHTCAVTKSSKDNKIKFGPENLDERFH